MHARGGPLPQGTGSLSQLGRAGGPGAQPVARSASAALSPDQDSQP
eukprot:CAMPEP_0177444224 /NCGR_PEP_ID=MMETSP0369-20130122/5882_1 /TAXON_ID=447022 ORGANISM="Scrippsiella hangoei-like, Strain SHHI-4" /NCGR_SAMPLE_ID=MMETSP0369 /ASSEMBLY_ACC=CAM_ASM_000364 /LENGTH=45 /DNA_ID= /DNA_START= /DNA_END= /DNA_ORIENTATION=